MELIFVERVAVSRVFGGHAGFGDSLLGVVILVLYFGKIQLSRFIFDKLVTIEVICGNDSWLLDLVYLIDFLGLLGRKIIIL